MSDACAPEHSVGHPASRLRRGIALLSALPTGAAGWIALPWLYMHLPVRWLPIEDSVFGDWVGEVWLGLILVTVGLTPVAGVLLRDRILRRLD